MRFCPKDRLLKHVLWIAVLARRVTLLCTPRRARVLPTPVGLRVALICATRRARGSTDGNRLAATAGRSMLSWGSGVIQSGSPPLKSYSRPQWLGLPIPKGRWL